MQPSAPWANASSKNQISTMSLLEIQQAQEKAEAEMRLQQQQLEAQQLSTKNSVKLKSLLGVGGVDASRTQSAWGLPSGSAQAAAKPVRTMKEILEEERLARERAASSSVAQSNEDGRDAAGTLTPDSVWGGKVTNSSTAVKTKPLVGASVQSLRDIMQHEEQLQQQQLGAGQRSAASGSSWVAKAAKGLPSTNWNNPAFSAGVTPTPASQPAISSSSTTSTVPSKQDVPSARMDEGEQFWNFKDSKPSQPAGTGSTDQTKNIPSTQEGRHYTQSIDKKSSTDLGGMNSEMAEWCTQQLRRLANNDDLTLVQFCLTLESPVEVREYLAAYLGSTPQVSFNITAK